MIEYLKETKRMILNDEINMELISLSLSRLIDSKKNKQGDLRLENTKILKEIQDLGYVINLVIIEFIFPR